MKFQYLAIQGFRSYKKDQVFSFYENEAGLYLVTGENQVNLELGSNGSGKSSLWDALCWVLTGKSVRGLRSSSIVNWDETDLTSVMVQFIKDDIFYEVIRTHDPISLSVSEDHGEPKVLQQEELEALTGLNHAHLTYAVLMGQFNSYFFDLSSSEKLAVFSEALSLEIWEQASVQAAKRAKGQREEIQRAEVEEGRKKGQSEVLVQQKKELAAKLSEFRVTYEVEKKVCLQTLATAQAQIDSAKKELTQLSSAQAVSKELEKLIWEKDDEIKAQEKIVFGLQKDLENYDRREKDFKSVIDSTVKISGKCPSCKQVVNEEHKKKLLKEYDEVLEEFLVEKNGLKKKLINSNKVLGALKYEMGAINLKWEQAQVSEKENSNKRSQLGTKLAINERLHEKTSQEFGELNRTAGQLKENLAKIRDDLSDVKNDLFLISEQLGDLRQQEADTSYWIKGFKEVRLFVVREALDELEIEVNNSLIQLGLKGWEVQFDIERETKGGKISRGFQVMIKSPEAPESVAWESWCGGETQRLRIAGAIGFASLIRNRRQIDCGIEIWDEPTAHLSPEGITDLLEFFEGRCRELNRQIWLVDHRSLSFGGFSAVTHIVRNEYGSRIKQDHGFGKSSRHQKK